VGQGIVEREAPRTREARQGLFRASRAYQGEAA